MTRWLTTIDIYILRRIAKPLFALSGITMMILALENAPRLLRMTDEVERPLALIARFLVVLMPEHLAFGLMVGTFLSVALVLRRMALDHELDALFAVGLSPVRLMRMPMMIGVLLAMIHVGLRGYAEPWGERQLDEIGRAARSGDLGIAIAPGEFRHFGADVTLIASSVDNHTGVLRGLFLQTPQGTITAQLARIRNGGHQGMIVDLDRGVAVRVDRDGRWQPTGFQTMRLPIGVASASTVRAGESALNRADRQTSSTLYALARATDRVRISDPHIAAAELVLRVGQASLIPILPWLALALAIPPLRSTSPVGIGAGLIVIVAFIEGGNMFVQTAHPAPYMILLLGAIMLLTFAILRQQRTQGLDVATRTLAALFRRRNRSVEPMSKVHRLMVIDRISALRRAA
jgi:lipopolysaccharide export system permease protein